MNIFPFQLSCRRISITFNFRFLIKRSFAKLCGDLPSLAYAQARYKKIKWNPLDTQWIDCKLQKMCTYYTQCGTERIMVAIYFYFKEFGERKNNQELHGLLEKTSQQNGKNYWENMCYLKFLKSAWNIAFSPLFML